MGGGLKAFASSVIVTGSQFSFNRYFGLLFFNSSGSIQQTNVFVTDAGPNPTFPDEDLFGVGIAGMTSLTADGSAAHVKILDDFIFGSALSAIAAYGSFDEIGDTKMQNQTFDVDVEQGLGGAPLIQVNDLGGNQCDADGDFIYEACEAVSSSPAPSEPIDDGP